MRRTTAFFLSAVSGRVRTATLIDFIWAAPHGPSWTTYAIRTRGTAAEGRCALIGYALILNILRSSRRGRMRGGRLGTGCIRLRLRKYFRGVDTDTRGASTRRSMMRRDGAFACGASRASSRHLMAIVRRSNTLAQPGAGAGGGDWSGRAPRRWRLSGTRFPSLGLLKRLSTLVAAIDGAAAHESTGSRKVTRCFIAASASTSRGIRARHT